MIKANKGLRHVPNKKETYLIKIVDRSGSMHNIEDEMRNLLNVNIKQDKENVAKMGDSYLTLVTFDHEVETIIENAPLDEVDGEVSQEQTSARGTTALYDAIGMTLTSLKRNDKKGANIGFLVEIYSDGGENASHQYSGKQVADMIAELKGTGKWTFQYYGCDDNAIKQAQHLNLPTMKFAGNAAGVNNLSYSNSLQKSAYFDSRGMGLMACASLADPTPVEAEDNDGN